MKMVIGAQPTARVRPRSPPHTGSWSTARRHHWSACSRENPVAATRILHSIWYDPDCMKKAETAAVKNKIGYTKGSWTVNKPNGDAQPGGQPGKRMGQACGIHFGCSRTSLCA